MPATVYLHVGLPKSGTTYVQAVLGENKQLLQQRASLLYPGTSWSEQVDAVKDLCRMKVPPRRRAAVRGAWERLAAEISAWDGDAVVSMEWLCLATRVQIQRLVADLEPAEVRVVFTVRDVARTLPAAWQEFCRNGKTWPWPGFLEQVTSDHPMRTEAGDVLWSQQDMKLLLDRWCSVVPAERVHVVTLPQRRDDPAELWRRTATVLGIDPEGYDLSDLGRNVSLGMESAELMRRVNEVVESRGVPLPRYDRVFKEHLAKEVLTRRRRTETTVVLPESHHAWATTWAEAQVAAIERAGVHVVGDLDDLRPTFSDSDRPHRWPSRATTPDDGAVLDAAVDALVAVALDPPGRGGGRRGRAGAPARAPVEARRRSMRQAWYDATYRFRRPPRELVELAGNRLRKAVGRPR